MKIRLLFFVFTRKTHCTWTWSWYAFTFHSENYVLQEINITLLGGEQ